MLRALGEFEISGIHTTIPAHKVLIGHPDFAAVEHSTKWVEDAFDPAEFAGDDAPAESGTDGGIETNRGPLVERAMPVEVNGKRFSVKVWVPEGAMTAAPGASGGNGQRKRATAARASSGHAGSGTVAAPMQGTIVKVLVAQGDTVELGQTLLVLEAMKMENNIVADTEGTVSELRVSTGQSVGTGDVLAVIE